MFDKLLENLDDIVGQLGVPADRIKSLAESLTSKLEEGGADQLSALMETAQEYGLPVEKLQQMLGGLDGGADAIIEKASSMLGGEGKLGGLGDMAKGLFGKN